MTSLTDVYDGGVGAVAGRRRRLAGAGLVALGVGMVVGAIPVATTGLADALGLSVFQARELSGVLAGLGVPAVLVGILAVLPARRATRATAAIGAGLALLGVSLFGHAYPYDWVSSDPGLAALTALLYAAGTLVTFWCLFVAVATFKRRTEPGGAARVELTDEGTVRVVSREGSSGMGGIGLVGREPDGDVGTQTNRGADRPAAGDGGTAVTEPGTAEGTAIAAATERGQPDRYCGNCRHFEYRRADGELVPYCGLDREALADMDACQRWESNDRRREA